MEEVSMYWLSVLGLTTFLLFFWVMKWYNNYKKVSHIKGFSQLIYFPFKVPFIAPTYNLENWRQITELMKTHGDPQTRTLRVSMLFYNTIIVSDKELLKELFTSKQAYFEKPKLEYDMLGVYGDNIISASSTEIWKRHHAACNQAFNDENLKLVCEKSIEAAELLFKTKWDSLPTDENNRFIVETNIDFANVTLEVLARAGYGISFGIFDNDNHGKEFAAAMNHIIDVGLFVKRYVNENAPMLYPVVCKLLGLDKSLNKVRKVLADNIENRRLEIEQLGEDFQNKDILSLLVKANVQDKLLSEDELISNAWVLTGAGFHTSSTTLSWLFYELTRNPSIQEKARQEVYSILGKDGTPTLSDYEKFQYLNAVIFEGLRLHPPVTSVLKNVCKKETTLGKITIQKGTNIEIFINSTHIDERYWNEPLKFDPSRFLNSETQQFERKNDFSFIPFSRGMRKCIGFRFAEREICMLLARLLQKYEFYSLSDKPAEESVGITVQPANLKVSARKL